MVRPACFCSPGAATPLGTGVDAYGDAPTSATFLDGSYSGGAIGGVGRGVCAGGGC